MGYSYYIVAKNKAAQQKLLKILNRVVSDFDKCHPALSNGMKNYWVGDKDLAYVHQGKATSVGVNYCMMTDATTYFVLEILKWAAAKAGKQISANKVDGLTGARLVPYIVYDGEDICSAEPIPDLAAYWRDCAKRNPGLKRYYFMKRLLFRGNGLSIKQLEKVTTKALKELETAWATS